MSRWHRNIRRMLMHMIDQWEWTLAPSVSPSPRCLFRSYTETQRKLCSDGKTWKGDGLVVNRLRRSNSGVEYMFHVFT
ncbi:hypothetical protein C5167_048220 [Papaver somniferum]|uniref:Uncharacterized protein n=1 Tax=Papaver somniferum TaxID=3469 RepID=A0A4Y7KIP6_PAPSO|nr:hypothetical protein C5167_048220 [Papaver somniferum]